MTDHLYRELAPVSSAAWEQIEDEAKSRLVTHLAARKLVDFSGPHGWAHSSIELGRVSSVSPPADGVVARQRRVLPLVEMRASFTLSRSELDDADRGAGDIDLANLDQAVRSIAMAENVAVFQGYGAAGIQGVSEASSHSPIAIPEDMEHYPTVVSRAADVLRQTGVGGPYGLAISPELYTKIVETTEHGGYLLLDHLRKILDGPVVWAPGVPAGVVLSLRGGDFTFTSGQDISVGYSSHDGESVQLYLEESFSFQVHEPDAAVVLGSA